MSDPQVLIVTSAGASSASVVPVLAAIEAAGMRVRAIDVGAAGGPGASVADRIRRTLLGESAERRLKRELELALPDAAVVFDPHAALALTVARDQVPAIAGPLPPVIGVVGELDPVAAWAKADCDRLVAVDDLAAVALADAGIEGERILVVGAIGERAFAEAATHDRNTLRSRFKLGGKVALVEVAGLGAEATGQLALQLSLLDGNDRITFLFDAAGDADAAAVLRRQVPTLGLRAKLFGATSDAAVLWRAADVIVARPRPEVVARIMLVGGKLVALIDDAIAGAASAASALESRKRGVAAKGLLLLSSALEGAFTGSLPAPTADGSDNTADIVAAVASDKRGVIDERRQAAQEATRGRVRAASAAAQAAAASQAMPGELEDLGGGAPSPVDSSAIPDSRDIAKLRAEVSERKEEMTRSMMAARAAATRLANEATVARQAGKTDEANQLDRKADAERARMHSLLGELATLETELAELERVGQTVRDIPRREPPPRSSSTGTSSASTSDPPPRRAAPRSIDDELAALKRNAGSTSSSSSASSSSASSSSTSKSSTSTKSRTRSRSRRGRKGSSVDDELAALKRKMQGSKKK